MAFMPTKTTIDDPDEQALSEIDPKIRDYLAKQMQSASAEQTPEYRQSIRQDVGAAADQKRSNNFAALLANSAAKIGQIGGKEADSSAMDQFAKQSNAGVDQSMDNEAMKPQGLDPKVLEYVKARQNAQQMAKDRVAQRQQAAAQFQQAEADKTERWNSDRDVREATRQDRALAAKDRADAAAERDGNKKSKESSDAYTKLNDAATNYRGNSGAQQASKNLLNIKSAKDLIEQYPNPNDMSNEEYGQLVGELGKIATGGVASEHSQRSVEAQSFNREWQAFKSKVGNAPEPAELGDFIKRNASYLDRLEKTNQGVINAHVKAKFNGHKHALTADQIKEFKEENFPEAFAEEKKPAAPDVKPDAGFVGTANAAGSGSSKISAADQAGLDFLKANPNDPDAAGVRAKLQSKGLLPTENDRPDVPMRGQ